MSNVGYTPGSGKTIATDTISAVEYQRTKLAWGTTGTARDMRPVSVVTSLDSTASAQLCSSAGILFGYNVGASTGTALKQQLLLRDSTSNSTGNVLAVVVLSTGAGAVRCVNAWFGDVGVKLSRGLRVVRQSTAAGAKNKVVAYVVSP